MKDEAKLRAEDQAWQKRALQDARKIHDEVEDYKRAGIITHFRPIDTYSPRVKLALTMSSTVNYVVNPFGQTCILEDAVDVFAQHLAEPLSSPFRKHQRNGLMRFLASMINFSCNVMEKIVRHYRTRLRWTTTWSDYKKFIWHPAEPKNKHGMTKALAIEWRYMAFQICDLLKHDEVLEDRDEYYGCCQRMSEVCKAFSDILRLDCTFETRADIILDFFHYWNTAMSDVLCMLKFENGDLDILQLRDVPSRHQILWRIRDETPPTDALASYVLPIILSLPKDGRECSCCTNSWDADLDEQTMKLYTRGYEHEVERWVDCDPAGTKLESAAGYENVPVRLPCLGKHVFCAGCLKKWLDNDGRLQCPFRDFDFGIVRDRNLIAAEDLARRNCEWLRDKMRAEVAV